MNYSSNYQSVVVDALRNLYDKVFTFLPNILAAIVILVLGWLIAIFLSKLVVKVLEAIKIDHLANQLGLKQLANRAGRELSLARLGGWLVKWFFFIGSFIAAADVLNLTEVSNFLYQDVLGYAGHVVVAMAILLLGILAANFLSEVVAATVRASGLSSSQALGAITKWAVVAFTVIAALAQLQIATTFLQDLFRAIVAMFAIAGGIAFGLGGRDHAKKVLDEVEHNLTK